MRTKLADKYQKEREELCNKLINILQLDRENSFLLHELDNNIEKQNAIMSMKDEIQRVFACSTISSFRPNFECKRPYLNIVKSILRKQGYLFNGSNYQIKLETGIQKISTKYFIFRKTNEIS